MMKTACGAAHIGVRVLQPRPGEGKRARVPSVRYLNDSNNNTKNSDISINIIITTNHDESLDSASTAALRTSGSALSSEGTRGWFNEGGSPNSTLFPTSAFDKLESKQAA